MKWEDERYCRIYTRDTSNWVSGPWQARAVLPLVVRKLDRSGVLELDDNGLDGLAALVGLPVDVVEPGMAWWLKKGTFVMRVTKRDGSSRELLTMPNYVAAQECSASDRKRSQDARDRMRVTRRDDGITNRDDAITMRDESSRMFAARHEASHGVTPPVPSRAIPPEPPAPARPLQDCKGDSRPQLTPSTAPTEFERRRAEQLREAEAFKERETTR